MKSLASQLKKLGLTKNEISNYYQKLNRRHLSAYDIRKVELNGNEIRFYTNSYGGMVLAFPR